MLTSTVEYPESRAGGRRRRPHRTLTNGQAARAVRPGVFVALGDYHGYAALLLGSIFGKAWEGGGSHLDASAQARYMECRFAMVTHSHTHMHKRRHARTHTHAHARAHTLAYNRALRSMLRRQTKRSAFQSPLPALLRALMGYSWGDSRGTHGVLMG